MTPTDAARLIADMKPSGAKQFLIREHGEPIARALLAAEERNAALEAALRDIRRTCEMCEGQHPLFQMISQRIESELAPEGGAS